MRLRGEGSRDVQDARNVWARRLYAPTRWESMRYFAVALAVFDAADTLPAASVAFTW